MLNKVNKIRQFVELEQRANLINVKKYSPLFEKLISNVRKEYNNFESKREPKINKWILSKTEATADVDYLEDTNFVNEFSKFKETQELPFSIVQEISCRTLSEDSIQNVNNDIVQAVLPTQNIIRTSYFVNSSFSRESFSQIQRQHKIWWLKFGASPGKYSISDQKSESFHKSVAIRSCVDNSTMEVEHFKLFSLEDCIKRKEVIPKYSVKYLKQNREIIPDVIQSTINLEMASLALLFDAVNLIDAYTAFHRRLAPYQLALVSSELNSDLVDLARFIQLLLKETDSNIVVLNETRLTTNGHQTLEEYLSSFDQMGIPFCIILDRTSLENGLLKLRNRNTTISETIHLSDISSYVVKIFNSG